MHSTSELKVERIGKGIFLDLLHVDRSGYFNFNVIPLSFCLLYDTVNKDLNLIAMELSYIISRAFHLVSDLSAVADVVPDFGLAAVVPWSVSGTSWSSSLPIVADATMKKNMSFLIPNNKLY